MDTISRAIAKIAFWRWPKRIRALEEQLADMQQELWDAKASEQKVKVHHRTGMFKIMKWIHTTHRLDKPASGIRALLQKSGFAISGMLLICQSVFGQAPFQRNPFTTNPPAVSPGVSVQGLNNISITNVGSGTSWWFYAVRPQTVARLIDVTNIIGSISAGTNALVQTNGVNVGSIGTLNFNSGVTGFVSGSVVTVGVTASGAATAQVWTNDNQSIRPVGFPLNFRITPSNSVDQPIVIMGGTNGSNWIQNGFGGNPQEYSIWSVRVADDNDNFHNNIAVSSASDVNGNAYGHGGLFTQTNGSYIHTETLNGGGFQRFTAGNVLGLNGIRLTTNNSTAFLVDDSGGISVMKGVVQNWPASQGAAQSVLTNNGSGILGWGTVSGDSGGTNARQFGSAVLSNLVGTVAKNVTNVVSLSTTNATSKPLTNSYANGVLTLFGLEQGANITLTPNGSNIVIATAGTAGEVNVNGEVSVTNSTRMGWVFDKSGVTNRLRSIQGGNGILLTNESTNIMVAIDPAVVAAVAWANSISNLSETKQNGSAVLTNLVATVARNVTNVVSLSTTNATSKPLTNSYASGVLTIFGIEQGSGHLLTMNASNIVTANDWVQTASTTNVVGVSNWVNAVSNYVTAATNSASVTNWINSRQPASANLTNWSLIPTGSMANVVSTTFLTNWANSISNLSETKQNGSAVLTNLVGTVARNVTNVVSLSTTNATSKPLTNSYANGVLTIFGVEQGSGLLLTMSSNIVVANDWAQTASTTNVVGVSNWVNAVSNYVTAATNAAQVTNWITQRQPANAVLSNLVGTVASNVTNVISLSTTNATSKPLTNSYANGVLTLFGLEEGANITLTPNGSNIVIATSGSVGEANVNGEVSLTNNANGIYGLVYDKVGITNRIKSISAGANIVITNAGTNLWIASTAISGFVSTNMLFVSPTGDNATAERNSQVKPYQTISNALANALAGDVVKVLPGNYVQGTNYLNVPNNVHLVGSGIGVTTIEGGITLQSGSAINPGNNSYLSDFTVTTTNQGGSTIGTFPFVQKSFTNIVIDNVRMVGHSDSLFISHSNRTSGEIRNSIVESDYDSVVIIFATNSVWNFNNSTFLTRYPWESDPVVSQGTGLQLYKGTAYVSQCTFKIAGTNQNVGIWVHNDARAFVGGSHFIVETNTIVGGNSYDVVANDTSFIHMDQPIDQGRIVAFGGQVLKNQTNIFLSQITASNKLYLVANGATNKWPLTNALATQVLTDVTGNGQLSWATPTGSGEANVNGEVSLTNNANGIYGLVYDKIGITNRIKAISAGANIVITNAGTNLWIASTASGGSILTTNMVYVSPTGDDATGTRNDPNKPFSTLTNAMAATKPGDVVFMYPGSFTIANNIYLDISNNVSLIGSGRQATWIYSDVDLAVIGAAIVPGNYSYIANFSTSNKTTFGAPMGSDISGGPQKSFTNAIIDSVDMWGQSDVWYVFEFPGPNEPCTYEIRNCGLHSSFDFIVHQSTSDSVFKVTDTTFDGIGPYTTLTSPQNGVKNNAGTMFMSGGYMNIFGTNANRGIINAGGATSYVSGVTFKVTGGPGGPPNYPQVLDMTNLFGGELYLASPYEMSRIGGTVSGPTNLQLNIITSASGVTNVWPKTQGAAKSILTNDGVGLLGWSTLANAGVGTTSLTTNANQFGAQTVLTIKEGALLTNVLVYPSNLTGPAIISTASAAQITNLMEWRQTNGSVGLAVSSNGLSFVGLYLNHSNAVAFRTNNISLQLNQNQTFTNGLKTNLVLQLTNSLEGVTVNLDAYGAGRLGGVATNAWQLLCVVPAGNFIYWPPGSTNGNFDVLLNSNQIVTLTFRCGLGASNILASYLVREGIGAN